MHSWVKGAVLGTFKLGGGFCVSRQATRHQLRIIAYHGVENLEGLMNQDGFMVSPDIFEAQLDHIGRHYNIVSLDECAACIRNQKPWPSRAVLITFDDGYLNNLIEAIPILQRKGMPAVFFITTGFVDGAVQPWWFVLRNWIKHAGYLAVGTPPAYRSTSIVNDITCMMVWEDALKGISAENRADSMRDLGLKLDRSESCPVAIMNWDQVRKVQSLGYDLAPHTVHHVNLGAETISTAIREIHESIDCLNRQLGVSSQAFSYPYGRRSDIQSAVPEALRQRDIAMGVTTMHGFNQFDVDPYMMFRLNVTGNHRGLAFEKLLAMG